MNTLSQKLVWLVVLLLQLNAGFAQEHNYTQYTIEDGLPTNYVYGVVEDNRGYIWAYTEQGIARFDGYEWKAFGLNDGLGTLDCYSMCPLEDGSFLVGGKGRPSVVKGDSIFKLPVPKNSNFEEGYFESSQLREGYPPKILYLEGDPGGSRKNLLVHSVDSVSVYVASPLNDMFVGADARVFKSDRDRLLLEESLDYLEQPQDNLLFVGELGEISFVFWKSPFSYFRDGVLVGDAGKAEYNSCRAGVYDGLLQLYVDSVLYKYDRSLLGIIDSVNISNWCRKYDVNRVFQAKNGDLWIASRSKGILHIRSDNRKINLVSNKNHTAITVEGVVSIDGVVYAADDRSNLYEYRDKHLVSVDVDKVVEKNSRFKYLRNSGKNELFLGRDAKVIKMNEAGFEVVSPLLGESEEFIEDIIMEDLMYDESFVPNLAIFKGVCEFIENENFVFIEDVHYHFIRNIKEEWRVGRSPYDLVYSKKIGERQKYLYVGNGSELICWSESSVDTLWHADSLEISALYELGDMSFLIGTKSHGVFQVSIEGKPKISNLFRSKHVTEIASYNNDTFWATTYSGVYRFTRNGDVDLHLTYAKGLPSEESYDLDFFSDSVAVGTANGLAVFAQDISYEVNQPILDRFVKIEEVKVEGVEIEFQSSKIVLAPGENDLEIRYSLLHTGSSGEILYDVELHPYSDKPITQKSRSIRYSQLAPGNYEFLISATANDGSIYHLEHPLSIKVKSYLYQQGWFQMVSLLLLIGGGWFYYRSRLKDRYKENSERLKNERLISELQLEALRSQMNPHFVFNALGSIQYYIQSEEKELADSYLTKFAQLMRKYLDSSKRDLVTVSDEIDLLRQYIELERMRYDHFFTYRFELSDQIEDSDQLPSMLLQPFVENAIIHGLANRALPGGEILISVSTEGEEIVVVISDNGIGIEKSNKLKRKGHRSRATEITNERIVALRNSGKAQIELTYELAYPDSVEYPGTKATLRINCFPDGD